MYAIEESSNSFPVVLVYVLFLWVWCMCAPKYFVNVKGTTFCSMIHWIFLQTVRFFLVYCAAGIYIYIFSDVAKARSHVSAIFFCFSTAEHFGWFTYIVTR